MTDHMTDRLVSPMSSDDDVQENSLRPHRLEDYIGQERVKGNLQILLDAAKLRGEALDHVLLYGPPGLGKTSLSLIISAEMGVSIQMTSGPAIEHAGDLASILTALEERDVLFIDEIHRLSRVVEERLYSAMEDFALDLIIGKGPSARNVRLPLKPFTVVAATTRVGALTAPLRDRFGAIYRLDFTMRRHFSRFCGAPRASCGSRWIPKAPLKLPAAPEERPVSPTGCSAACVTMPRCAPMASSPAT